MNTNRNLTWKKRGKYKEIWRRLKRNRLAMTGLLVICIFISLAIFADYIIDYEIMAIEHNAKVRLQSPSKEHWFGTDNYGRDIFARVIHGSRISLTIGFFSMSIAVIVGCFFGSIAGYYGGFYDGIIMRIMDTVISIPPVLLSLVIIASLGPGMFNLVISVTISTIPNFARIIRSSILTVAELEYIEAAKACGVKEGRIIARHILPNAIGPIIVQATMSVADMIIIAAGLSFIGMGIQPPAPEWGTMLSEGKDYMRHSPYFVFFPGMAIVLSALSLNLLGDGLRDAFDPRLKD